MGRSRKGCSKGCYRHRRDLQHSNILLKTFWCTSTPDSHSPSEELFLSQQWGSLVSSMLQSKFICTAVNSNMINHFKVVIHKLIFNTHAKSFLPTKYKSSAQLIVSLPVNFFTCCTSYPLLWAICHCLSQRTVASSASVQIPLPGHKLIRFEKE